jgi:(2Fe-2S) ferredoxin
MPKFIKHIFILHESARAGSSARLPRSNRSRGIAALFKVKLAQRGIPLVRANKSGCLDQCELGPTVAVYPEGVFYGGVRPEDVDEIIQSHIVNDRPVDARRTVTHSL